MSPSPEDFPAECLPSSTTDEFSVAERKLLLALAHDAIESALAQREISLQPPAAHLAANRGVFTSLYLRGELRGCVGYAFPIASVYVAVAETARGAAFDDPRFIPVSAEDLPELRVSLSILSPLQAIRPDQVEIGRHGLLVTMGPKRGLLLPQVPIEHGWDRVTFLAQTCHKAGLPGNAWKEGATLQCFTAEVFGDE